MNKIVAFSRGADYLHQRALRNRRDGSMLDALDLMRGALERDRGNMLYAMDLAELYCEMGCHRQSIRVLLSVLSGDEPAFECLFGMCCNYMGLRDYQAAYSLMIWFLANDPGASSRPEVSETLTLLISRHLQAAGDGRKQRRAQHMMAHGKALIRSGDAEGGMDLMDRARALVPGDQNATALLAITCGATGDNERAMALIGEALAADDVAVKTRCIAAQLYAALGEEGRAREQFAILQEMERDDEEEYLLLHAAAQSGADHLALEIAQGLLRLFPYDAQLLHVRAAALINTGGDPLAAGACWAKIARTEPDNIVAKYYAAEAARGGLDGVRISYEPEFPAGEQIARIEYVRDRFDGQPDGEALWDSSERLRATLRWMANSKEPMLASAAISILCGIDREDVALTLRECLLSPSIPPDRRQMITAYLTEHGHPAPYIAPDSMGRMGDLSRPGDRNRIYTPAERRVLVRAFREPLSGRNRQIPLIEEAWQAYLGACRDNKPRIRRPAAWAGALVALQLQLIDDDEAVTRIAKIFGCPPRMIRYCAGRIARKQRQPEENEDETD